MVKLNLSIYKAILLYNSFGFQKISCLKRLTLDFLYNFKCVSVVVALIKGLKYFHSNNSFN